MNYNDEEEDIFPLPDVAIEYQDIEDREEGDEDTFESKKTK